MSKAHSGIHLVQLGCSKNSVDGERFLGLLESRGIAVKNSPKDAHAVVVNTCGFIEPAREEAIDEILQAIQLKNAGKIDQVYVIGCLATRSGDELRTELPEVDGIYGVDQWQHLVEKLTDAHEPISLRGPIPRHLLTPKHSAYLRIADGCNRGCSYCAIPLMRGRYVSTPLADLLAEAEQLRKSGVKELLVVAQELNDYGRDLGQPDLFKQLMAELDALAFPWLRILYTHPPAFNEEFLEILAKTKSLVPYIDYPIEHSHPKILWSMGRKKGPDHLLHWIKRMREAIPDMVVRTSIIVGYPGEGEAEFEQLLEFTAEAKFERFGVFLYSTEEGTRAAKLPDLVAPREVAEERRERLLDLGNEIAEEFHREQLHREVQVIVEGKEQNEPWGRTKWDAPEIDYRVRLGNRSLRTGSLLTVTLKDTWEGGWIGEPVIKALPLVS
ncbi:MAG: 30S ribosomal protein S12 methylthiotransferase RimO [bacterium]|nr:30S ribosomal protein S12 methylthiotransferase RimO [bacterium]